MVTEVTVRILKKPETARALLVGFPSSEDAGECVSRIIGAGIIPGGMEIMDGPAIAAVEEFVHAGYPLDVEALLIVELDGPPAEVDHLIERVEKIARDCRATSCKASRSEEERLLFWAGRKAAFPAVGRISPDYYCMDGTIPRAQLPLVLKRMKEMSAKYGLRVANVFHAGDGNLHPLILYDANVPGELEKTEEFGAEILKLCVEVGGVLTGEHGVGVEKRDLMPTMFSEIDLNQQQRVKCAFDAKGLLNPGKVFPQLHRCAELGRLHVHAGQAAVSRYSEVLVMRFGLFCSPKADAPGFRPETGRGFFDYLEFNVEAEALGFHSSFSVEHHFSGWNQVSSTLMLLSALAMRTRTLRLGTAVIVPPWHNPVLLAEEAATLDLLSHGRLDLGIGKGYRHSEFKGFQISPDEAEARFDEAVEVMTRAWTTRERFSHKGRFWHFEDIIVEPPPAQRPHPPLWVAAGNPHSIRRAAARGFNLILDQYASAAALGERIAIYKAEREANGLPFDPMQVTAARQLYVAKDKADKEAALVRQAEYTRRTINVARMPDGKTGSHVLAYADRAGATEENALFGTPEEIAGMIEALRDAGVTYVLLTIAGGVDQLRRFAREIMPAFAREPAARAAE